MTHTPLCCLLEAQSQSGFQLLYMLHQHEQHDEVSASSLIVKILCRKALLL